MRILEESAQTDNSGKIVNGMNGLNLTDMTFHEVAMRIKERRMDGKDIALQVTKKIGQVLGGSGDAGACHQLVNHLVQLGYKVKPTFSSILDKHQDCFPIVLGEQVSEGFDGQTRTELLEAGNELDRVKVNSESSHQSPPLHDHDDHTPPPPHHDDDAWDQVNHQLGSNLSSQGSRQTLNAAVQR